MKIISLPSWVSVSIAIAAAGIQAVPMYRLFPPGNDAAMPPPASAYGGQRSSGLGRIESPDRGGLGSTIGRLPSDSELEAAMTANHQTGQIEPHLQHTGMRVFWNHPWPAAGNNERHRGGTTSYRQAAPIEPHFQYTGMGESWNYPLAAVGYNEVHPADMTAYHVGPINPQFQHTGMGASWHKPLAAVRYNEPHPGDTTAYHRFGYMDPRFQYTGIADSSIPTLTTARDNEAIPSGGNTVRKNTWIELRYGGTTLKYPTGGDKFELRPYPDDHRLLRFSYAQGKMDPTNFEKYTQRGQFDILESIFRPEPDLMKAIQTRITGALLGQHIALSPPGPGVTVSQGVFLWPPLIKHHNHDSLWMTPLVRNGLYKQAMSKWSEHSWSAPKYWYLQVDSLIGKRHVMMNAVDSRLVTEIPNEASESQLWLFHEAMVDTNSYKPKMALIGGMFLPSVSAQALQLGGVIRPALSHLRAR